ncbi:MAG: hypothetical protein EOP07_05855 [Proteobacteria bacterium]|nr:MAG: hypothetical protein EOP07_05855 [Pseudomonadota bacterium]
MRVFGKVAIAFAFLQAHSAFALPIGFGRNQGDLDYDELKTKNFIIYHDRRAPNEAKVVLESLEAARPRLETWLGAKRDKPLPVLMSSTTSNASFANFITDVIELQSLARGGRDLAWHEYTHSTMYRHLDNIFGPAGSIIHLPWMPAWWIEGLAETMSVSGGSDTQYGIERYYAVNGNWPSYDKLHALYDGTRFSTIGYGVSGAFVSYILRTYDATRLPQMLNNFYDYSMPWYWPWSFVPFNKFMPMDQALTDWTGKSGYELYEEYKSEAGKYWKSRTDLPYLYESGSELKIKNAPVSKPSPTKGLHAGQALTFNSSFFFQTRNDDVFLLSRDGNELSEAKVKFKGSAADTSEKVRSLPDDMVGPRIVRDDSLVYQTGDTNSNYDVFRYFWIEKGKKKRRLFKRTGYVQEMWYTKTNLVWIEEKLEVQQICSVPRAEIDKLKGISPKLIKCQAPVTFPESLRILGNRTEKDGKGNELLTEIWMQKSSETLLGDKHEIVVMDANTFATRKFVDPYHGKALSLAFNRQGMTIAYADSNSHFLRRFNNQGQCVDEQLLGNMIDRLFNNSKDQTVMSLWRQDGVLIYSTNQLPGAKTACRGHDEPTSPLQVSMRYPQASLKEILAQRNPWKPASPTSVDADAQKIASQAPLGNGLAAKMDSEPSEFRARPVFAFPWIGIDALGYQYGMLSVPLMDHLQNETVQLIALYGASSRFPNIELNIMSNRFETTWSLDLFRRQTWNGSFRGQTYYFDERGAQVSAARYIYALDMSLRLSYKQSDLIPYLGDELVWNQIAKGYIRETGILASKSHRFFWSSLSYYLSSNLATKFDNKNYDYEQTGVGTNLSIPLSLFGRQTVQNWGLSYSRVRGPRRKLLKEAYRPLRTYVPGSGGGLNEINQPIFGPGALTSAAYGDTQARFNFAWTVPLIPDLAKLVHIVYLQRLDFTAFFNYGNAWFHTDAPKLRDSIKAHGYNLDLTADVKGVKLNAGIGVGQVVGNDWEMYALFGFDALISQGER